VLLGDVLDDWQLLRTRPGQFAAPNELADQWADAADLTVPHPVSLSEATNADDFDWWQRCAFDAREPAVIDFQGLTFPATVFVDGERVADVTSMFLPVRVEVEPGRHEICVYFGSLTAWLKPRRPRGRWRSSLVAAQSLRWARTTLIGRAPVYGDLPAYVGIWRPVVATSTRLHATFTIRPDTTGHVVFEGSTTAPEATPVEVALSDPDGHVIALCTTHVRAGRFTATACAEDPRLWWPRGYGSQPIYRAAVHVDGQRVAERLFGFRTVNATDGASGFELRVNGVRIFCRGATWSPPNATTLNVDHEEMRRHVSALADAGANMVRIVGGLVYEQAAFWECCAELGMLVWQDAMQATFDPPPEMSDLIAREMEHVLDEVSGNPALAIVSGGSETLQQPEMLGVERTDIKIDVVDSLLPEVTSRHSDAHYVRASPSPPPASDDLAIRPDTGIAHWFGVGGYLRPISDVRSASVGFAAECLAFANPPSPEAVERHFGSASVAGHHPDWKAGVPRDRGSSWDFEDVRDFYARDVFGEDLLAVRRVDPERYLQLGRLAIAEAMGECFRFWRRSDSGCSGALVLSAKDTRPGAGWGLLDVDCTPKAALTVLARIWAPVAVILSDGGLSGVRVDVHNDTPRPVSGRLSLTGTNAMGTRTLETTRDVTVPAHSSLTFAEPELSGKFRDLSHAFRFGVPTADGIEASVCFDDGRAPVRDVLVVNPHPRQVDAGLTAVASQHDDDHWDLCVSSKVALRYVSVTMPGWVLSDNVFHLAAHLPYTIRLTRATTGARVAGTVGSIDLLSTAPVVTAP